MFKKERVLNAGTLGQVQARRQTPQTGPRRPRTTSPTPALPGAIGPKGARDRHPGGREPGSRRPAVPIPPFAPRLCGPPPARGPPAAAYLRRPSVCYCSREGGKIATEASRGPHRRGTSASAAARALPECGHPGWARAGVHVGCGIQASARRSHVESGLPAGRERPRLQSHAGQISRALAVAASRLD